MKIINRRTMAACLSAATLTLLAASASFAGQWQEDENGWWYRNDDGSYPQSTWQWIDSDGDGTAECYYFYSDGYMAHNNDIDGSYVNDEGQWTVSGKVKHKTVGASASQSGTASAGQASASPNQTVMAAARQMILTNSWNSSGASADSFAVVDINGDGLLEVVVYHNGSWIANGGWDDCQGSVLYYSNGNVLRSEFGYIDYLSCVDQAHSWVGLDRVRGKAISTICSFSPAAGMVQADAWFDYYERSEDAGKTEYYYANMKTVEYVPATAAMMDTYLNGEGRPTGLSAFSL